MGTASATGDNYTTREREMLGRYRIDNRLKYRDPDAGYCTSCENVYNVRCPRCDAFSGKMHDTTSGFFSVQRPLEVKREEGRNWVVISCRKCDFGFRVMVHNA